MKLSIHVLQDQNAALRRYMYHVESPLTQKKYITPLEFIAGRKTKSGYMINRSLKLHIESDKIQRGCKFINFMSTIYAIPMHFYHTEAIY